MVGQEKQRVRTLPNVKVLHAESKVFLDLRDVQGDAGIPTKEIVVGVRVGKREVIVLPVQDARFL
jgi:hypothetical protein